MLLVLAQWVALFEHQAAALQPAEAVELLQKAEQMKSTDPVGFGHLLSSLVARPQQLSPAQQEYVRYLQGWKAAYDGQYDLAITRLRATIHETQDVSLKFRANAAIVNVLLLGSHYEEAFTELTQLLMLLPKVSDPAAREQGLLVAALLYNEVGQYDLATTYAQKLIDENFLGVGICKGSDEKLRAQVMSGKIQSVGPEFADALEACTKSHEVLHANFIRTYAALAYITHNQLDEALRLLTESYAEALQTRYPRLISSYEALLAEAYQKKGNFSAARQFATRSIESAVPNEITQPLVTAYRILYEQARQAGDYKAALEYHEKYAALDKGYLDVTSARQLAYQRVAHESLANELQIDTLNKENHVLQLERQLGTKAVENSRLYIMLLLMTVGFVALWAYRTKRLQLHFMSLSQIDGLTGIANRPHFLKQAQLALERAHEAQQPVCIILCDLDHFKSINDRFGHAAGDQVLKQAVAACQVYMRSGDLFGRFGGEEFGILLAGCELEDARRRAEQLRATIAEISVSFGPGFKVSASFGIASTASSGYDLRQLLVHADSALYAAKRAGRNRVITYDASVTVIGTGATGTNPTLPSSETGPHAADESDLSDAQILGITGG